MSDETAGGRPRPDTDAAPGKEGAAPGKEGASPEGDAGIEVGLWAPDAGAGPSPQSQGCPAPLSGYPAPLSGYPAPLSGYPAPVAGYPAPVAGYGYGPPPPPPGYPPVPAGVDPAFKDKKLAAGLCGVLIGQFGVHKFVLGYTNEGIVMAVSAIGGWILFALGTVLSFVIVGLALLPFALLPMATSVIGLVEGIIYLTKSDYDFVMTYGVRHKGWF